MTLASANSTASAQANTILIVRLRLRVIELALGNGRQPSLLRPMPNDSRAETGWPLLRSGRSRPGRAGRGHRIAARRRLSALSSNAQGWRLPDDRLSPGDPATGTAMA